MTDITDATTVLRLEVETSTGALPNLIQNPHGEKGSWGWTTPYPDTYLSTGTGGDADSLVLTTDIGGNQTAAVSEDMPFDAGEYTSFGIDMRTIDCSVVVRLDWIALDGSYISSTPDVGPLANSTYFHVNSHSYHVSYQAPVGTGYVRVVLISYAAIGSGFPPEGAQLFFTYVMLTRSPTVIWNGSSGTPSPPYVEPRAWLDILGPTHSIDVDRTAFDVGLLSAEILDATLDPAQVNNLPQGAEVRLRALVGGTWWSLYEGRLRNAKARYDNGLEPTYQDRGAVRITITASDNMATLSGQNDPRGVNDITELCEVLEGRGVPWLLNGYDGGIGLAPSVLSSYNENATVADQVAIVRDTHLGFAWVDARNILNVTDNPPTSPVVSFSDVAGLSYADIDVDYNSDRYINHLTVDLLQNDVNNVTTVLTMGPYSDGVSVRNRGARRAKFTIHGVAEANVPAYAQTILDANSNPDIKVNSLTMLVRNWDELAAAVAIDLCSPVGVVHGANIDQTLRVMGINHTITAQNKRGFTWHAEYTLDPLSNVASPTVAPRV